MLERASRFGLRRFPIVGLARYPEIIFLELTVGVSRETSFLSGPRRGLRWMFCIH